MNSLQTWIKSLFPYKQITYRLCDLNLDITECQDESKNTIIISIEKNNKSRQFCFISLKQLNQLFIYCPISERALYESIPSNKQVKAYIDFEYYTDVNRDIQDHYIGIRSSVRLLYSLLNYSNNNIHVTENNNDELFLKQFLILEA